MIGEKREAPHHFGANGNLPTQVSTANGEDIEGKAQERRVHILQGEHRHGSRHVIMT